MSPRRLAAMLLGPAVLGLGLFAAPEPASAQERSAPGILKLEFEYDDDVPTLEVEFVDPAGNRREIEVDLRTGQIIEDESEEPSAL